VLTTPQIHLKADLSLRNKDERTPLMAAAISESRDGREKIKKLLQEAELDFERRNR